MGGNIKTNLQPVVAKNAPKIAVPVAMQPAKPLQHSWTVWFNGVLVVLGALSPILSTADPALIRGIVASLVPNPELGVAAGGLAVAVVAFVNVWLRIYKTSQPIAR